MTTSINFVVLLFVVLFKSLRGGNVRPVDMGKSVMTYYGAKELARSFRTVRDNTIKIAGEIPEEKYGFHPAEGCRSVAETLVHIAVMPRLYEQIHVVQHRSTLVGFDFFGRSEEHTSEL